MLRNQLGDEFMPSLLKHLARNLVMGIVAGWITLALLLVTNTNGLQDVVFGASSPLLPLVLLIFGFSLTFGSLSMGASIMMMPYEGDEGNDRGSKVHTLLASLKKLRPGLDDNRRLTPIPVKDKR
jgi:hypothetical protein